MELFRHDPLEWVYPDKLDQMKERGEAPCFSVPRGGVFSLEFVLTDLVPGEKIFLETTDPACRFFLLKDVCVNLNTGEKGWAEGENVPKSRSVTRNAPFRVYDVLCPVHGNAFRPDSPRAVLYLRREIGRNEKAGLHSVTLCVRGGKKTVKTVFFMKVSPVRLPRTGKDSVKITNWLDPANFDFPEKTALWTPSFWKKAKEHASLMYSMRENMIFIPLELFFRYDPDNGHFSLLEKELEKWICTFTDAGIYWLEGGHLGGRDGSWTATDFKVIHSGHSVRSLEGCRDIAQMGNLLSRFIRKNALGDRWVQHVADEPIACNADSYRIFAGTLRRYLPGIPLVDAASDPAVSGALDIWCPLIHLYEEFSEDFQKAAKLGDRLWLYTCCHPGGPWLNRLNDMELTRSLLLGWGCASCGAEGFLHWGWNRYRRYTKEGLPPYQDPYEVTAPFHDDANPLPCLPPGDTHIVYPGPGGAVYGSLRMEAQREGIEDWELIRLLRKKDPETCGKIVAAVFRSFSDYTPDPEKIRSARNSLLAALEKFLKH
ncbi:MAG: DUF4091 domain-containing protein [Lentisphaeria bacterium]|nr:DUF4091 domain-containing protein [Lentisphaeria bacterium]